MSHDERVFLSLVLSFAVLLTVHVSMLYSLTRRPPRWRALVALPVFPLVPYWGVRSGMRIRPVLWGIGALTYMAFRVIASR
jgi:hypothetical protein